jgi:hypothetical protein
MVIPLDPLNPEILGEEFFDETLRRLLLHEC